MNQPGNVKHDARYVEQKRDYSFGGEREMANSKSLIAYYSRKGTNYVGGSIVCLPVGNTEIIAKKIRESTGSDVFHIQTIKSYLEDYAETTHLALEEQRQTGTPARITSS